ncbi:MAG: hypothetical protein FWF86_05320 [Clostridia bacterium]|nr:hypothetical protein [Clostridia bacterium]
MTVTVTPNDKLVFQFEDGTEVQSVSNAVSAGSLLAFDYPDEHTYTKSAGERAQKQTALAGGAGESILAAYSYHDIDRLLSGRGFQIHEHLTPDKITELYFEGYNTRNPKHRMTAFDNVNYCLAERK